jgi:hypothetical protein
MSKERLFGVSCVWRTNRQDAKCAKGRLREDDAFDAVFEKGDVKVDEKG